VNVADLAGRFGGGGHARAAGARMDAPVDQVMPQIVAALNEVACAV
jgi:phosphoesterase RecJ-like protein